MRLPTTIGADNKIAQRASLASRRERITEAVVRDAKRLTDVLTRFIADHEQLARLVGMLPSPTRFEGRVFGTAGAQIRIEHDFARPVRWQITNWKRSSPGGFHGIEEVSNDGTTLVLASYIAGTGTLEIY